MSLNLCVDFKCEKCKIIFVFFFLRVNSLIKHYPDIVDIKPANMEELTEVITAAEFHPNSCNTFVYSSSKGTIRLCDMRASALCDRHSKCKFISLKMTVSRKLTSAFTDLKLLCPCPLLKLPPSTWVIIWYSTERLWSSSLAGCFFWSLRIYF